MLIKYDMQDCKSVQTTITVDFQKSEDKSKEFEEQEVYQSAIGSSQYLTKWRKPEELIF